MRVEGFRITHGQQNTFQRSPNKISKPFLGQIRVYRRGGVSWKIKAYVVHVYMMLIVFLAGYFL